MRRKYFLLLASEKLSIKKLNFLVFLRNLAQKIKIFVQKKKCPNGHFFGKLFTNSGVNIFVRRKHR